MSVQVLRARPRTAPSSDGETAVAPKLRACAYARVSSDSDQQESSYESQCTHFTNMINEDPMLTFVNLYADEGISGTSLKNRDGFNRMIADCEAGKIDVIYTKSISRFARNTVDCLNAIRKLKALGIAVIFQRENLNTLDTQGEVLITILSSLAQSESQSISDAVSLGVRYRMAEGHGNLNYNRFLGYTKKDGRLVVVPEEASIVRLIFREYLEGFGTKTIARHLNEAGIKTPTGGDVWRPSTITSMLGNEKYCGDLLLQKYYTEDFLTHKTRKNDGKFPQYYVEDDHAPIVPKAIFYQVQGEVMRRGNDPHRLHLGSSNALAGRLICGRCGRSLKQYQRPDAALNDWRCRERASTLASNNGSRTGDCGCRIALEREVKSCILDAFNRLPSFREEIVVEMTSIREGELRRIDALIEASEAAEKRMEEQLAAIEEAGGDTSLMDAQIAQEHARRDALLLERAGHANKEVHLRLLMELITLLEPDASNHTAPGIFGTLQGESRTGDGGGRRVTIKRVEIEDGACADEDEFFRLTRPTYPEGVIVDGRVEQFDNEMVIRYLDRVVVNDQNYEVRFKGGVTVTV